MKFLNKILKPAPRSYEEHRAEMEEVIQEQVPEKAPPVNIDEMMLHFLTQEFTPLAEPEGLKAAAEPSSPPLCILKSSETPLSVWYRMPIRGESGVTHIPDFVIFRGNNRIIPREKSPDIIIECRELIDSPSNRTDPRVVQEVIGRAVDIMPGICILVTNRELSGYAKTLADAYGIFLVGLEGSADPGYKLFKTLVAGEMVTQEKLLKRLEASLPKLKNAYEKTQKRPEAAELLASGNIRERIIKVVGAKKEASVNELSSILKVHTNYLLNELYTLEKGGKLKRAKGKGGYLDEKWILGKTE